MLNGRLVLHGVDVEHVARATLKRRPSSVKRSQVAPILTGEQHERLLTYLIIAGWELSQRYDPHRADAVPFGHLLTKVLRCRVVDWLRKEYGDNRRARARGERHAGNHPQLVSLDELATEQDDASEIVDTGSPAGRLTLADTLGSSALDPAECCDIDSERLLGIRNIEAARYEPSPHPNAYATTTA